jgi:hypothetical protein
METPPVACIWATGTARYDINVYIYVNPGPAAMTLFSPPEKFSEFVMHAVAATRCDWRRHAGHPFGLAVLILCDFALQRVGVT